MTITNPSTVTTNIVRLERDNAPAMQCRDCHGKGHRPLPWSPENLAWAEAQQPECATCEGNGELPEDLVVLQIEKGWTTAIRHTGRGDARPVTLDEARDEIGALVLLGWRVQAL